MRSKIRLGSSYVEWRQSVALGLLNKIRKFEVKIFGKITAQQCRSEYSGTRIYRSPGITLSRLLRSFSSVPCAKPIRAMYVFPDKALPGYNALPLQTLLRLIPSGKNSGYNTLAGAAAQHGGEPALFTRSLPLHTYLPFRTRIALNMDDVRLPTCSRNQRICKEQSKKRNEAPSAEV